MQAQAPEGAQARNWAAVACVGDGAPRLVKRMNIGTKNSCMAAAEPIRTFCNNESLQMKIMKIEAQHETST